MPIRRIWCSYGLANTCLCIIIEIPESRVEVDDCSGEGSDDRSWYSVPLSLFLRTRACQVDAVGSGDYNADDC